MNCGSAGRGFNHGKWTCRSTSIRTNTFSAWKRAKAGPISPRKNKCPNVTLEEIRQDYQSQRQGTTRDRKSTRLNSSHLGISYAVFCLKKKNKYKYERRYQSSKQNRYTDALRSSSM